MKKILILVLSVLAYGLFSLTLNSVYAKDKELTLFYTGQTHAMLYHCNCPLEPDGGVARRATLIQQLRNQYPDALLLDSGNFFSAGLLDQNTQNTQLDMQRAGINLAAMELMRYDALAISEDELNFGKDFLADNMNKVKLNFISANLGLAKVAPYIIKEVSGIKVGITGLTNLAAGQKAEGLKLNDPKVSLSAAIAELKKKGVNFVILLSNLGEEEDLKIIKDVPGIAVIIDGRNRQNMEALTKVGNTVILRPAWQGRKLGKAVLSIKDSKIINASAEEVRVSDKLADDAGILSILPRCFADTDCKKEGLLGSCQNAGSNTASCMFSEAIKIKLTVIASKECLTCNPESVVNFLKNQLPGLEAAYLYYPDKEADKLIKDLKVSSLPVYILDKEVAKDKNFTNFKVNLEEKDSFYMLKPEFVGLVYFFNRPKIQGKLDLFISLYDKDSVGLLEVVKEFKPIVHFLAIVGDDKIDAPNGGIEAEEDLRAACVQKYYPSEFWNYITCRAKNITSSWWDDCLPTGQAGAVNININKIKSCAKSEEGRRLLKENCSLNQELKIMFGPTYLLDNREIFSSKGVPSKEELRKIIKR